MFFAFASFPDNVLACSFSTEHCDSDDFSALQAKRTLSLHPRRQSSCPSEVYSIYAGSLPHDTTRFTRVTLADYPSTGSSWLKFLLAATAKAANAGNPSCSIYSEHECQPSRDVDCDCNGFRTNQDAALIKSHYPAQELFNHQTIDSAQYNATMKYDRIVQLVRHPIASIKSNVDRWNVSIPAQSVNLLCWGAWWERAKEVAGDANVLVLRYEDLCMNTTGKVHEVLQFLGGSFASISLSSVSATLDERPDLQCIHQNDLRSQTQVTPGSEFIMRDHKDLMSRWGYRTDGTSEFPASSASLKQTSVVRRQPGASTDQGNPWLEVW